MSTTTAPPASLLAELRAAGFTLRLNHEEDRLLISPASQLSPEQRQAIADGRAGLIAALLEEVYGPDRPPAGRAVYYGDHKGRPATKLQALWWAWEGGPKWYRVRGAAGAGADGDTGA